jgi:hypothetical protein
MGVYCFYGLRPEVRPEICAFRWQMASASALQLQLVSHSHRAAPRTGPYVGCWLLALVSFSQ